MKLSNSRLTRPSLKPYLLRTLSINVFSAALLTGMLSAQEPNPTSVPAPAGAVVTQNGDVFFYKVKTIQRDIDAVNYLHRSGSTKIGFEGTNLLPNARGEATVKSERGGITIDAEFKGLTPANGFGPEYLTYVLWAITPDGRPANLGEILPAGTKNNITVTTALQSFGMIVTAEPYFSVSTPSDLIVLKNVVLDNKTNGVLEKVNAHTTLLPRGSYAEATDGSKSIAHPITRDERSPLELYQAYNAIRIAQAAGADKYSPDTFAKANEDLKNAADIDSSKKSDRKLEITYARQAVQRAEDSRIDTLRKQASERQRNAELAKNNAQDQAANSQAQAERERLAAKESQLAAQQAEIAKTSADAEATQAKARELDANQRANDVTRRATEMREKLRTQLNEVLQTSETPRGLVVNLADVLFDTGKFTLKSNTQVSLARIAGILQSYPGLKVQVEGYTDSVGSDALNQKLSDNRASTTRDFLIKQGVGADNITEAGYGKADPVADNSTAAGRAQNRRVNLVVSGDAIGVVQSAAPTN